jgi:hypothetical protein
MQRLGAVALAAVLGLGLVACGDDGDDDAATETTEDSGDETTTTASDDDTDDTADLGDFTGECAAFSQAFANAGTAIGSAFSGDASEEIEAVADYFDEVSSELPEEIRDDFSVFADAYAEFARALAESDIDFSNPESVDPEDMAELQALSQAFSSPEVQEASNNIQTYVAETCQAG